MELTVTDVTVLFCAIRIFISISLPPPATVGNKMEFRVRRRNFVCRSRFGSNNGSDRCSQ